MSYKTITEDQFESYVEVQSMGQYNMLSSLAIESTGLDKATYMIIIKNYSELMKEYPEVMDRN